MGQLIGWLLLAACVVFHAVALWQVVRRIRHRHRRSPPPPRLDENPQLADSRPGAVPVMKLFKNDDLGKLILRLVVGVLMLFHGVAKLNCSTQGR
jgi:hypothetical protein